MDANISINILRLPIVFTKSASVITMTYTVDGEKRTKVVTGGGATMWVVLSSDVNLEAIYHTMN
jgi:hypothetical protein